jgi:SAM-dependent methyltransferase
MITQLHQALGNVGLYIALQKGIGADRIRYRCLEEAELKPGDRVLDVGCGPAYYFDRLPEVDYVGFDTCEPYVAYARRHYGQRGDFHCEILTADHLSKLGQFDAVLLFGLLHHLDDAKCSALLDISARGLAPGGRVISCDPTLHPGQCRVSRWLSENDRGGHVRRQESYDGMARASFADLETHVLDTLSRVPTSHYIMRMAAPLVQGGRYPAARPSRESGSGGACLARNTQLRYSTNRTTVASRLTATSTVTSVARDGPGTMTVSTARAADVSARASPRASSPRI